MNNIKNFVLPPDFSIKILARRWVYSAARQFNWLRLEPEPLIVVFCYHSIADDGWRYSVGLDMLEKQLECLMQNFTPVSLSDINSHLKGDKIISQHSFAITLDDGYRHISDAAVLFKACSIQPAVFVLARPDLADSVELDTRQPLADWEELKYLASLGWEIGCHSSTHPDFGRLQPADYDFEIAQAKVVLEERLNMPIRYFAYPKGRAPLALRSAVKEAGFELALTMDDEFITVDTDAYAIPRVGVDRTHSLKEFASLYRAPAMLARRLMRRLA